MDPYWLFAVLAILSAARWWWRKPLILALRRQMQADDSVGDNKKGNCLCLPLSKDSHQHAGLRAGVLGACSILYTRGVCLLGSQGFRAQVAGWEGMQGLSLVLRWPP